MDDSLDDYEAWMDQQMGWEEKIFDYPLANDPFTLLEDSIEATKIPPIQETLYPPSPILGELEASIEGSLIPPTFPDPHFNEPDIPEPPFHDERLFPGGYSAELPDPTLPGEERYWREPPLPRPHLGRSGSKPKPHYKPLKMRHPNRLRSAPKSDKTLCPKKEGLVESCESCGHNENCNFRDEEDQNEGDTNEE